MDILRMLRLAYKNRRKRKAWQRAVQVMAMVVVFCTTYALILPAITMERTPDCGYTEHTHTEECYGEVTLHTHTEACCNYYIGCGLEESEGHAHSDECYGLVATLICTADHAHEGTCYEYASGLVCGLEESEGHTHTDDCHKKDLICGLEEGAPESEAPLICGYTEHTHTDDCYPEETSAPTEETTEPTEEPTDPTEEPSQTHDYVGEAMQAQVALPADTAVPADAALTIAPMTETDEQYATLTQQVTDALGEEPLEITLLDISFYDAAGEYLSVSDTAEVTLTLDGAQFVDGVLKLYHFTDDGPVVLDDAQISRTSTIAEDGTETIQTHVTFQTEGFSVFAIVEIYAGYERATDLDSDALVGSYYIVSYNGLNAMMANVNTNNALDKEAFSSSATLWTIAGTAGNYTLSAVVDGTTYYLNMDSSGKMTLSEETASAGSFTITIYDDGSAVDFGCNSRYINQYNGVTSNYGFAGWTASAKDDSGSKFYLYKVASVPDGSLAIEGLAGKTFAIVNETSGLAMQSTATDNGLAGASVTVTTIDGVNYIQGTDITLWTFTQDGDCSAGEYYISTTVDGATKYLNLNVSGGSELVLSDTKDKFAVFESNTIGKVILRANEKNINKYGGQNKFAGYSDYSANEQHTLCVLTDIDSEMSISYGSYTITVHFQDIAGNELLSSAKDITMTAGDVLEFSTIAPTITDYIYREATLEVTGGTVVVESVEAGADDNAYAFRFYEEDPTNYYSRNANVNVYLIYRSAQAQVLYNMNRPASNWVDDDHNDAPALSGDAIQTFTDTGTLCGVGNPNTRGYFIANTFSSGERDTEKNYVTGYNAKNSLTPNDAGYLPPGAEYKFLGWQAENIAGETCLFPENAEVTVDADNNLVITDTSGVKQTVESGTTLVGQWKMISNVIFFYVNHGDTMLEGENNQTIGSYNSSYYTDIAAIGHIYNIDDPNQFVDNGTIQIETHDKIEAIFQPSYNASLDSTYVVIDAVKKFDENDAAYYADAVNYNESLLEAAVAVYLQSQTGKTIQLDGAVLDKSMITPEHYKLYWYSMKPVDSDANAYHADGVLVAKTQSMEIYKTFSGLTRDQASTVINNMTFPLHLLSPKTGTTDYYYADDYLTLSASSTQDGVYENHGWVTETNNIYHWTLHSVLGQSYGLTEVGQELAEYDCSTLISVHYDLDAFDESVKSPDYNYKTTSTFSYTDTEGNTLTETDGSDNPLVRNLFENDIEGGKVESIIFANFYTPTGTGMFSLSKVSSIDQRIRIGGAKFTLTKVDPTTMEDLTGDAAFSVTKETVSNGSAHFSGLEAGTYILQETVTPAGYQTAYCEDENGYVIYQAGEKYYKWDATAQKYVNTADATDVYDTLQDGWDKVPVRWKIVVTTSEVTETVDGSEVTSTKAEVTMQELGYNGKPTGTETILYDNKDGGVKSVLLVPNEPDPTTVTVTKTFEDISRSEIMTDLASEYYIEISGTNSYKLVLNKPEGSNENVVEATNSGTDTVFTWTIKLEAGNYTVTETNFQHKNYLDAAVTVTGDTSCVVGDVTRTDSNTTDNTAADTATFSLTKGTAAGKVNITNAYTNEFVLRLCKIDGETNQPLSGVKFNIYGDFTQGQEDEEVHEPLTYKDENGVEHTVYWITTLTTNDSGLAQYDNMQLLPNSRTFLYVIEEVEAATGNYIALTEPIVKIINIDVDNNYANGIYTQTIENYEFEDNAKVKIEVRKKWDIPDDMDKVPVTFTLYRQMAGGAAEAYSQFTVNSATDPEGTITLGTETANYTVAQNPDDPNEWVITIKDLPYAVETGEYQYFVAETHMDGFSTRYSYPTIISGVTAGQAKNIEDGKPLARYVTITNSTGYALPESGGMGVGWHIFLGISLILASLWLYWRSAYKKKRGGVDFP